MEKYQAQKKRILEFGNVLSYVFHVNHDILDKYEITDGVINEDVVDFSPTIQYDLIISIVTLPEVGWYEGKRDHMKTLSAINNLKRILAPGGQVVLALGLGYNTEMDALLRSDTIHFDKRYYLKRISGHRWQEVSSLEDIKDLKYDYSIPTANGVLIGVIEKKQDE
ncbi:MAG: nodulation S family protein [Thermoproteota archaeon]|nr:nodulation S family protein [Thermoproteota archaeon]